MSEEQSSWPWETPSPITVWKRDNLRRVDVAGVPVSVHGEPSREFLEHINQQLAHMKMGLHRILHLDAVEIGSLQSILRAQAIARAALDFGKEESK